MRKEAMEKTHQTRSKQDSNSQNHDCGGILHRWYLEQGQRERVAIRDPDSCEENQKVRMMSGSYSWTLFEAMRGRKFAHRVRIHGSRFLP